MEDGIFNVIVALSVIVSLGILGLYLLDVCVWTFIKLTEKRKRK